jgi:hypothetical protein
VSGVTITYFEDDLDSFDVLVDGTGDVGISSVVTTPSGVWSFNYQVEDVLGFPNVAEIHALVRRELSALGGFINPLFPAPTIKAFNELPVMGSDSVGGDTIDGVFTLHSGVQLDDWVWSIRLTRRGDSASVPDAQSTATMLCVAGLVLLASRRFLAHRANST